MVKQQKHKRKAQQDSLSQQSIPHTPTDVHEAPNGIMQLQRIIGNTAVQRLMNQDTTIQRFGVSDLWDTVVDVGSAIWDSFTNSQKKNNTGTSDQPKLSQKVPDETFTVTDNNAIIRRPPPDLSAEKGKPTIPAGTEVKIAEVYAKNGKYYVQLQDGQWTAASNMDGLTAKLAELNPSEEKPKGTEPEDVVVPKPSSSGILGLPTKPEIENAEFDSIVQEIEHMEQNPVAIEKTHSEETGEDRSKRVEKIAELREKIADLTSSLPTAEAKQAQAYLYRRLAPLSPYYNQIGNTNLLGSKEIKKKSDQSAGWYRTCNVTVPAMVLEGVGKTKDDYIHQEKLPLLRRLFDALEDNYKQRKEYEDVTEFDDLRMPDFMAVVAIARKLPDNAESLPEADFIKKVADARIAAAKATTAHSTMTWLIEQFGGSYQKHAVHKSELEEIGTAQKDYTKAQLRGQDPEEWRELYNSVKSEEDFKKLNSADQKRYKTLWNYEQCNKEKADETLAVSTYRDAVLKKVNPLLNEGAQILVGMEEHFVRLDALDETGIQVDDPGERGFKNLQVTWEQARNLGYFKGFWSISG